MREHLCNFFLGLKKDFKATRGAQCTIIAEVLGFFPIVASFHFFLRGGWGRGGKANGAIANYW